MNVTAKNYSDEHYFNGFRYFKNADQPFPQIEHSVQYPDFLFKYYWFSKNSINALKHSYLYASHPYQLNDILDSSKLLLYTTEPVDFSVYKEILGKVFEDRQELEEFYLNDIKPENNCSGYIECIYHILSNAYGIISLTENENDTLMWPHYTQETGFQLKFNLEKLKEGVNSNLRKTESIVGIYPMNYTDKLIPINVSKFRRFDIPFIYSTNVKSDKWKYENEWRIIVNKAQMGVPFSKVGFTEKKDHGINHFNRYVAYGLDAIEEICLGWNFFTSDNFSIKWDNEMEIEVEPLNHVKEYEHYLDFLNFTSENLSDKVCLSGVKYDGQAGEPVLIRIKEKVTLKKISDGRYILYRNQNEILP